MLHFRFYVRDLCASLLVPDGQQLWLLNILHYYAADGWLSQEKIAENPLGKREGELSQEFLVTRLDRSVLSPQQADCEPVC